ncbi:MAG: hypothetical protein EXQ47_00855 [Bryobacterales bacterium]|nr:hypothetical protein [Bryobacterales bacterium]
MTQRSKVQILPPQPILKALQFKRLRSASDRRSACPFSVNVLELVLIVACCAIHCWFRPLAEWLYRETHVLLDELADAVADGTRKVYMESVATVPLLIIDDFGMRKLPHTAAEDLLEIVMRRYERASTLLTSNRPVEDWGKLLGDVAAVSAMLDRLLHHGHVLKCGPRSWRTKTAPAS